MVRALDDVEPGARAERLADRGGAAASSASVSRVPWRKSIGCATPARWSARAVAGLAGRMQREAEEDDAAHAPRAGPRRRRARSCGRPSTCRPRRAEGRPRGARASASGGGDRLDQHRPRVGAARAGRWRRGTRSAASPTRRRASAAATASMKAWRMPGARAVREREEAARRRSGSQSRPACAAKRCSRGPGNAQRVRARARARARSAPCRQTSASVNATSASGATWSGSLE